MAEATEYDILLTAQSEGGFTVTVPELPDVVTEGDTREEAIEGYLAACRDLGYPVRRSLHEQVRVQPV